MYQNHTLLSHETVSPDQNCIQLNLKSWEGHNETAVFTESQLRELASSSNRDPSERRWFQKILDEVFPQDQEPEEGEGDQTEGTGEEGDGMPSAEEEAQEQEEEVE